MANVAQNKEEAIKIAENHMAESNEANRKIFQEYSIRRGKNLDYDPPTYTLLGVEETLEEWIVTYDTDFQAGNSYRMIHVNKETGQANFQDMGFNI